MYATLRLTIALPLTLALFACPGDDTTTTTTDASSTTTAGSTTTAPTTSSGTTEVATDTTGLPSTTTEASTSLGTTSMATTDGTATETVGESTSTGGPGTCPPGDGASIGLECGPGGVMCPECYTCQPFEGIVFQELCQILCVDATDCPPGLSCVMVVDKTGVPWQQCE